MMAKTETKKTETKKTTTKKNNTRKYLITNPTRMARRDVKLFYRPQLRDLRNQKTDLTDQYDEYRSQLGSIYDTLRTGLGGISGDLAGQLGQIGQGLQTGQEGILGALGQTTAPDQTAFLNAIGTQAMGGQNMLSGMSSDAMQTSASQRRQAELERMVTSRKAAGEYNDELDKLTQARTDIMKDRPAMMKQRLDELRQLAWQQQMAEKEFRLRAAQANAAIGGQEGLMAFINELLNGMPDGGGGGGNGNNGQQPVASNQFQPREVFSQLAGEDKWNDLSKAEKQGTRQFVRTNLTPLENAWNLWGGDTQLSGAGIMDLIKSLSRLDLTSPNGLINALMQAVRGGGGA